MDNVTEDLKSWLEAQTGQTLLIQKEERGIGINKTTDMDTVHLTLEETLVKQIRKAEIDEYFAKQEIVLRGQGTIHSDVGEVELPGDSYEIPLFGKVSAQTLTDNGMIVETEAAIYTIHVH